MSRRSRFHRHPWFPPMIDAVVIVIGVFALQRSDELPIWAGFIVGMFGLVCIWFATTSWDGVEDPDQ